MSDGGDQDLQIRIKTEADLAGADQTTAALKQVKTATEDASQANEGLGKSTGSVRGEIREFTRSGAETREILHGLSEAGKGGTDSIRGLATATRGFIGIMRTAAGASGPIGWFILAMGGLLGVFMALKGHAEGAGEGLKKTGEGADKAKTALEAMKKDGLDAVETGLRKIKEGAEDAIKAIDALAKANERISKAETDLQIAKVKAGPGTAEEKEAREAQIRQQAEQSKFTAEQSKIADEIAAKQKESNDLKAKQADLDRVASEAKARADAAALQLLKDQTELAKLPSTFALNQMAVSAAQSPEMAARVEQMQGRRRDLEKATLLGGPLASDLQAQSASSAASADKAAKENTPTLEANAKAIKQLELDRDTNAITRRAQESTESFERSAKLQDELKKNAQEGKTDLAEKLRLEEELRKVRERESTLAGQTKPREGFAGISSDFKDAGIGSAADKGGSAKIVESQTELAAKDKELSVKLAELSAKEELRKKAEDELKASQGDNTNAIREHTSALRDNTAALRAGSGGTIKRGDGTIVAVPPSGIVSGTPTPFEGQSTPFMSPMSEWIDIQNAKAANQVPG